MQDYVFSELFRRRGETPGLGGTIFFSTDAPELQFSETVDNPSISAAEQQRVINKQGEGNTGDHAERQTDPRGGRKALSGRGNLWSLTAVECVFMHVCVRPFCFL